MARAQTRETGGVPTPVDDPNDKPTAEGAGPNVELDDSDDEEGRPQYVVARRRTVMVDKKSLGPGQPVDLPDDEIEHLLSNGFIVRADAVASVGTGVRVGGLQIKGGRRPGTALI